MGRQSESPCQCYGPAVDIELIVRSWNVVTELRQFIEEENQKPNGNGKPEHRTEIRLPVLNPG